MMDRGCWEETTLLGSLQQFIGGNTLAKTKLVENKFWNAKGGEKRVFLFNKGLLINDAVT